MDVLKGKIVLVTGASSGIGEAIAKELVQRGLKVIAIARRLDLLQQIGQELQSDLYYPKKCNITNEAEVKQLFQWIESELDHVDFIINNAGVNKDNTLVDGNVELWRDVLDLNIVGSCIINREAIRLMTEKNIAGNIIQVNSVMGHDFPKGPHLIDRVNMYAASKHAVTAMVKTLRMELTIQKSKIRVTNLSPSIVMTRNTFHMRELLPFEPLEVEDIVGAVTYLLTTPQRVNVTELTIRCHGDAYF